MNFLTVTVEDANDNRATDSLTATASLPDTTALVVTITGPKPDVEFGTEAAMITVSGSAADNTQVTAVNWTDDHGHSGGATLSGQIWSIVELALGGRTQRERYGCFQLLRFGCLLAQQGQHLFAVALSKLPGTCRIEMHAVRVTRASG